MTFETALAGIEMSGLQKMCLFTLCFISIKLHGQSTVLYKPLLQLIQGGVTACNLETLAKSLWVLAFCKFYNILAISEREIGFGNF